MVPLSPGQKVLQARRVDGPTLKSLLFNRKSPMSRPLSLSRVREALKLNDREKLRQEFQETVPWVLDRKPFADKSTDGGTETLKGRRRTDPGAAQ